jgi:hypothetical protein
VSTSRDPACWAECGSEGLKEVEAGVPSACWGGPVQGVGVMGVGQDVPVEYVDELAILVVGELPVCGTFGLGVVHGPETDPVVARIGADPAGLLPTPVGQGIGFGVIGLVDDQEPATTWVPHIDEVAFV